MNLRYIGDMESNHLSLLVYPSQYVMLRDALDLLLVLPLPSSPQEPPGTVNAPPRTATLVARVTGNEVLRRELGSHVTH